MRIDILTLFPAMFDGPLSESIVQRARARGLVEIVVHDLRDWSTDRHRTVDDYPYGGGPGMVLKVEPVVAAVDALRPSGGPAARLLLMGAGGQRFSQALAATFAECPHLVLVCGHYEGVDQRVFDILAPEEISIGDYVLTGGELPAMVIVDSVVRLLPGVIDRASTADESFTTGLLEYPHYTRPADFRGHAPPDVLLSGHHGMIDAWRRREALRRTLLHRPDLLDAAPLSAADRRVLAALQAELASEPAADVATPPLMTDRDHLTTVAYANADLLAARQSIYAFRQPPLDFAAWALGYLTLEASATVLDIGCGNGRYLRHLLQVRQPPTLIGLDLSPGMLDVARRDWPPDLAPPQLAVADLQALPLPDACCDVVLAMHMLYHVPDFAAGLREARRVLRDGGQFLAATNGQYHLAELDALVSGAVAAVTDHHRSSLSTITFDLERGETHLGKVFAVVERHDSIGELVLTTTGPVVSYVASLATIRDALIDPAVWPAVLDEVERCALEIISREGALRVTTHAGVFVCA